jgi:hypothetical protein
MGKNNSLYIRARACQHGGDLDLTESEIEQKMKDAVKKRGGLFMKFVSPSTRGVPDRIVITPDGRVCFVELKKEGGRLSPIQRYMHGVFRRHNVEVYTLIGLQECLDFVRSVFDSKKKEGGAT